MKTKTESVKKPRLKTISTSENINFQFILFASIKLQKKPKATKKDYYYLPYKQGIHLQANEIDYVIDSNWYITIFNINITETDFYIDLINRI